MMPCSQILKAHLKEEKGRREDVAAKERDKQKTSVAGKPSIHRVQIKVYLAFL